MRSVEVVLVDVLADNTFEMTSADDQRAVQAFTTDRADEALSEGVGTGRPDRRSYRPNATGAEDLVEAGRELGVSIADQEPDRLGALGELIGQVPGLLDHPCSGRMGGH